MSCWFFDKERKFEKGRHSEETGAAVSIDDIKFTSRSLPRHPSSNYWSIANEEGTQWRDMDPGRAKKKVALCRGKTKPSKISCNKLSLSDVNSAAQTQSFTILSQIFPTVCELGFQRSAVRVSSTLCVATAGSAGVSGPALWPPRLPPLPPPGLAWCSTLPATAPALARLGVAVAISART